MRRSGLIRFFLNTNLTSLARYGQWKLMNFRYELWNEPDLHTYNILNYTLPGMIFFRFETQFV